MIRRVLFVQKLYETLKTSQTKNNDLQPSEYHFDLSQLATMPQNVTRAIPNARQSLPYQTSQLLKMWIETKFMVCC